MCTHEKQMTEYTRAVLLFTGSFSEVCAHRCLFTDLPEDVFALIGSMHSDLSGESMRIRDPAGHRLPTPQPIVPKEAREWRYGKTSAFPHPTPPSDGYVQNVQLRKTGQATRNASIDLFTCAGHVVVPVHERALRVIAPGPDVELEE